MSGISQLQNSRRISTTNEVSFASPLPPAITCVCVLVSHSLYQKDLLVHRGITRTFFVFLSKTALSGGSLRE